MLESNIQYKIIKKLESKGYYVIKLIKTNKVGIPDLIAIKGDSVKFIEVKTTNGRLSEIQEYRIKELRGKDIEVLVWTDYEEDFGY